MLGGNSHMTLSDNSNVELCGTYATDSPPITLYGLKHTIGTGSADLSQAVIEVPDFVYVNPPLTVLYLEICVFPTAGPPCVKPQLKVKVGIADPDATVQPGKRQVTIYNWSVQRG